MPFHIISETKGAFLFQTVIKPIAFFLHSFLIIYVSLRCMRAERIFKIKKQVYFTNKELYGHVIQSSTNNNISYINKRQKDCLWKQRKHYELENGSLVFIETLHKQ